ncbi:MAG: hypothetical protein Q8853_02540, partial [Candidatus Phytoplasma australasiaticum]|nr:hypothetical protein [Candidatus Phytoplasma australasiaticum]
MKEIYDQGLERKGQGKTIRQFHEESQLNASGLDRVPKLDAGLDEHGLRWTTQQLGILNIKEKEQQIVLKIKDKYFDCLYKKEFNVFYLFDATQRE